LSGKSPLLPRSNGPHWPFLEIDSCYCLCHVANMSRYCKTDVPLCVPQVTLGEGTHVPLDPHALMCAGWRKRMACQSLAGGPGVDGERRAVAIGWTLETTKALATRGGRTMRRGGRPGAMRRSGAIRAGRCLGQPPSRKRKVIFVWDESPVIMHTSQPARDLSISLLLNLTQSESNQFGL
jgi:hypothetical protein